MTTSTMENDALVAGGAFANGSRVDVATALVRVVTGAVFMAHGGQKLFVWGLDGVTGGFASMGVPLAGVIGPGVAFLELFGGLALVLGLLTRLVGAGLAVVMIGAIVLVHAPAGFFIPQGVEFVLMLFAVVAALAIAGPGRYSLDALIAARRRV